jgi:hypothetical protein
MPAPARPAKRCDHARVDRCQPGQQPLRGSWTDAVYLSADNNWDIGGPPARHASRTVRVTRRRTTSYTAEPGGRCSCRRCSIGQYRVIVRPDIYDEVYEGPYGSAGEANNFTHLGRTRSSIAVDELHPGRRLEHHFVRRPEPRSTSWTVGAGRDAQVSASSADDHDPPPTRSSCATAAFPTASNYDADLRDAAAGQSARR